MVFEVFHEPNPNPDIGKAYAEQNTYWYNCYI